jgi:hypothetical protein
LREGRLASCRSRGHTAEQAREGENMTSAPEQPSEQTPLSSPDTPDTADPYADWLTRAQVARALGISLISVRRRQASGQLTGQLVGGQWRFDPGEVDALADSLELDGGSPKSGALDAAGAGDQARALFAAAVSLARQAEAHNERLLALIEGPASRLLQQTTAEGGALRQRIAELEQKHTALLEASQASLDRAHERQLLEQEHQAKLTLKFEALAALKQWAPIIFGKALRHRGDTKTANHALTEGLIASLSQDQLAKLFESGLLSEAQSVMLLSIVEAVAAKEKRAEETTVTERPQNGSATGSGGAPHSGH